MDFARIEGPLTLELKRGCRNDSVIGGLDKFILAEIENLRIEEKNKEKIKNLFSNYAGLPSWERECVIREVLNVLREDSPKLSKNSAKIAVSSLFAPVQYAKGIGPKLSKLLENLNIKTIYDLLYYFPRDYIDLRIIKKIAFVSNGENVVLKVRVVRTEEVKTRIKLYKVVVTDGTGYVTAVYFNQPFLKSVIKEGSNLILHGRVQFAYGRWEMPSPEYEILEEGKEVLHTLRIVPVYRLTSGISQKLLRLKVRSALEEYGAFLKDYIDASVKERLQLIDLSQALKSIHFPENFGDLEKGKERLVFDELFELQLFLQSRRQQIKKQKGFIYKADVQDIVEFQKALPFALTMDQEKAMKDLVADLTSGRPMNRLLHGDVGSGKTVVALFAAYLSKKSGFQCAVMSPTEILAQQTFGVASNILSSQGVKVALLTSSTSEKERKRILDDLKSGELDVIIGTHAIIEEDVKFSKLGLVIVDEQHRFGVLQRASLRQKSKLPHTLVMSATPIPRTLALTIYGDLDISQIREMPGGRKPVVTKVFFEDESTPYSLVVDELKKGHKAYVVCPVIEESELELASVKKRSEQLKATYLRGFGVEILHGQMTGQEKESVMKKFRSGEIQVLVSTTVVEVGVDVRDATVMLVEDADRFGLSTLHQLRGRVGRGNLQSYCFLLSKNPGENAVERLRILEKTNNGFEVSEEDLRLRGPGEILGTRQHGLPDLRIATLLTERDLKLLEVARDEAAALAEGRVTWSNDSIKELQSVIAAKYSETFELAEVA